MSEKSKILKYKVVNTNIDKKFIVKNLDLEKIKSKDRPSGRRKPNSKSRMTLDKLAKIVTDGFVNVNHRIDNLVNVNKLKE